MKKKNIMKKIMMIMEIQFQELFHNVKEVEVIVEVKMKELILNLKDNFEALINSKMVKEVNSISVIFSPPIKTLILSNR